MCSRVAVGPIQPLTGPPCNMPGEGQAGLVPEMCRRCLSKASPEPSLSVPGPLPQLQSASALPHFLEAFSLILVSETHIFFSPPQLIQAWFWGGGQWPLRAPAGGSSEARGGAMLACPRVPGSLGVPVSLHPDLSLVPWHSSLPLIRGNSSHIWGRSAQASQGEPGEIVTQHPEPLGGHTREQRPRGFLRRLGLNSCSTIYCPRDLRQGA